MEQVEQEQKLGLSPGSIFILSLRYCFYDSLAFRWSIVLILNVENPM